MNVSEIIQAAYLDHLYPAGVNEPPRDILAEAITAADDSMTTEQLQGFFPQGVIEFESTGELCLTKEAETTSSIDLLARGYRGTGAFDYEAGEVILIGPSFPKASAFNTLKRIVAQLPTWGVYRRMTKTDLTIDLSAPQDLPTDCTRVVDVAYMDPIYWRPMEQGKDYWFFPDLETPTIQFLNGHQGATTHITYAADFTAPTTLAADEDLTEDVGLSVSFQEQLALGVAAKLLTSRESPRVQLEALQSLQDNQNIPPGAMTAVGREMWKEFMTHVASERARLHAQQRAKQIFVR